MNNSQMTAELIKKIAQSKKISISKLLSECNLNKNALYTMQTSGYYPRVEALAKIADYLNCSIDFLLGRPEFTDNENEELTDEQELIIAYRQLTDEGKRAVLSYTEYAATNPQYQKYTDVPKEA